MPSSAPAAPEQTGDRRGPTGDLLGLPLDVWGEVARGLSGCDVCCARAVSRAARDAFPAAWAPAGQACASPGLLAWCIDEGGLQPGVPLLRAAARAARDGAATPGGLGLCAAACCAECRGDPGLPAALHDALCSAAERWGEAGPLADIVRDAWESAGLTAGDIASGGGAAGGSRMSAAALSAAAGGRPELGRWLAANGFFGMVGGRRRGRCGGGRPPR